MHNWRLIVEKKPLPGEINMAIDYALLEAVASHKSGPILRFYDWSNPTITTGYSQIKEEEAFLDRCQQDNIPVIRRITGGGAVFHEKEITYSLSLPLDNPLVPPQIINSYEFILNPIIDTFKEYSIPACFSPINDLKIDGLKISGNAQTRKKGVLLQHGTILLDINQEKIFNYLKNFMKKNQLTCLKNFLGEKVVKNNFKIDFYEKIVNNFKKRYKINFIECEVQKEEREQANILNKKFFSNPKWG